MGSSVILPQAGQPTTGADANFRSGSIAPIASYRYTDLEPPNQVYIARDDTLSLLLVSSVAGLQIDVHYRMMIPELVGAAGQPDAPPVPQNGAPAYRLRIHRGVQSFFPTPTRVAQFFRVDTAEGWLMHASVGSSSDVQVGQLYAELALAYGDNPSGAISQALCSGYVGTPFPLSWPAVTSVAPFKDYGNIRSIVGTVPAAGAEIVETAPAGARWKVRGFNYTLTTSATAGNRETSISTDDGVNTFGNVVSGVTQIAATTVRYTYNLGTSKIVPAQAATNTLPLPDVILVAGGRIKTSTFGLLAGDQYSAPTYEVEEWLQP